MKKATNYIYYLVLLLATAFAVPASGAELKSLQWDESNGGALRINLDGDAPFTTEVLDQGRRLRVALKGATLGKDAVDIAGKGAVKGVFPYLADNGRSVFVDVLMRSPGELRVKKADFGYQVFASTTAVTATTPVKPITAKKTQTSQATGASTETMTAKPEFSNELMSISHSALPGGKLQVNIKTRQRPGQPGSFSTNRPPRLAFDFFGMRNALKQNVIKVGAGSVESITAVQTDDRTRIVFNLVRPVPYDIQINDDGIVLIVENVERSAPAKAKTTHFAQAATTADHGIERVDFRRTPEGGGRVVVNLSDPTVGIDIHEEGGEIIVDFLNTKLPKDLEQRLDVVDFATPVQTVDTFQQGRNVRMVIFPTGKYQHLAYQAGNIFNLNVNPVIEDKEQKKKDELGYSGERLSLNFQKISVRAALQVIADFTGLNFVTSDSVTGTLTLRLKDVPWDQALDIILQTRGLGMRRKGNVVWVAPAKEIADRERAQLEASKQKGELEPLTSELIEINYAKAADIAKILKSVKAVDTGVQQSLFGSVSIAKVETESNSLLSPRGNVTVDARTNTLLIQDTAAKIREVRKLISDLDKPVRQVLIETRIVEASDQFARNLGVRFGFQRITQEAKVPGIKGSNIGTVIGSGSLAGTQQINDSLLNNDNTIEYNTVPDGVAVNLPAAGINNELPASYAFEIFKAGRGFAQLLSLELSALEAEGQGKIIANPRLVTANQKEARIEQGQERIFTTTVLGVGSVVTKKAVLGLTVTPQITPDDRIVMDVQITQDSFVSATDPTIDTKQIETQVLLENGETAVIGGIFQSDTATVVTKVPILGDIPLLGVLFRKKSVNENRTELLIFLTPRIIDPRLNVSDARPKTAARA